VSLQFIDASSLSLRHIKEGNSPILLSRHGAVSQPGGHQGGERGPHTQVEVNNREPSVKAERAELVGDTVEEEVPTADKEAGAGGGGGGFVAEGCHSRGGSVGHGDTVALGKLALQDVGAKR